MCAKLGIIFVSGLAVVSLLLSRPWIMRLRSHAGATTLLMHTIRQELRDTATHTRVGSVARAHVSEDYCVQRVVCLLP